MKEISIGVFDVEVMHSTPMKPFKGDKGEDVILFENTVLIPKLSDKTFITFTKETYSKGRFKLEVIVCGAKKAEEVKLKMRPAKPTTPAAV